MIKNISIICILILSSCSTQMPKEVDIPIVINEKIYMPKKPELPIGGLNKKSTPDEVMKAYVTSIIILQADDEELRILLNSYGN